jgi:outer membrane protein insertion porin family
LTDKQKSNQKNKQKNKHIIAIATSIILSASISTNAYSQAVNDIKVEGLQHVEFATVLGYLQLSPNDNLTPDVTDRSIKSLYNTGFFKDVRIRQEQNTTIVSVEERPVIMQLDFSGVVQLSKDGLKKSLRNVNLSEGRFYDPSLIEKAEQALKEQYISKGYYDVNVRTVITPSNDNRVSIVFEVDEQVPTSIATINFSGNETYSTSKLKDEMSLSTKTWFSWYTQSNKFDKNKLNNDLESIKRFYLNNGYLDFAFENASASLSENKKSMHLNISIKEGKQYRNGKVTIDGELLGKKEELEKLVKLEEGKIFSIDKLSETSQGINGLMSNYGYAFSTVTPNISTDTSSKNINPVANINLNVDPGKRTYVRKINITGNDKTKDEVVRRELRQFEDSWFSQEKVSLSQSRLNRLGYFTDVEMNTQPIPEAPDKVDINVRVSEKPTGQFNIGAGFSSTDKLVLQTSIRQDNVLGTGTSLGLDLNTAKSGRTIALTQIDPYFTMDGISRYTDIYHRTQKPLYTSGDENFKITTTGTSLKFGVPFSENDTVYFGLGFDHTKLHLTTNSPDSYKRYAGFDPDTNGPYKDAKGNIVKGFGLVSNNVPVTIGWGRDSRDSALIPNKGRYQQAYAEIGLPIANLSYYKLTYQHQYYLPLGRNFTLAFNTDLGYGKGYGNKDYPVFKNFYAGGIGSVRGFDSGSLGPRDKDGRAEGGSTKLVNNVEMIFPLPGTGIDRTLRLYTFLDAGMVYKDGDKIRLKDKKDANGNIIENGIRASYGLGLSWISPIGPLKIGLGFPIGKKRSTDQLQKFQFQVGTSF